MSSERPAQMAMMPAANIGDIEIEFNKHLARVYDKGSYNSGTQGCQKMINDYSDSNASMEVASLFLRALMDKNASNCAKGSGSSQFQAQSFHASLFGFMAQRFQQNFVLLGKDKDPSVAKTVKRVVQSMKEQFFDQAHDMVRIGVSISLKEMLDYCFENKRYGRDNKKAKDLIFQPLFEELCNPMDRVSRQSACVVLRKLNENYMQDPDVVNILHSHTLVALGIKNKIYDGEFLMTIVDLLNEQGVAITLSECLAKAINHFFASVKFNMTGQNASNKVHRDQHICASLTTLAVLANNSIDTEYAGQIWPRFQAQFYETMRLLDSEPMSILKLR